MSLLASLAPAILIFAVFIPAIPAEAQTFPVNQPPLWSAKPDIPAFEKIENDHLAAAQRLVDELTAVKGKRTIKNTLTLFDGAMTQMNTANYFASLMQQVHPDAKFRDSATEMVRKSSAAATALSLNHDVYNALASMDVTKADAATRYYVQRQLLEFRLAGVDKDDATRTQLKKLNDDLTEEQSMFDRNISDSQKIVEATPEELNGLPPDYIARHKPGPDGKIKISTEYPDVLPAMRFSTSNALRRRLYEAFDNRAYPKNQGVLENMMKTRYEIATLLGYSSWADYNAADKMIKKGEKIGDFIQQVNDAARPIAKREFEMLLTEKRKTDPSATQIEDYEEGHLEELVRRSQYNFDSQSVRPYLPYMRVKQGILDTASKLFRVTFRQ
jgi:thimet oligopeptidase